MCTLAISKDAASARLVEVRVVAGGESDRGTLHPLCERADEPRLRGLVRAVRVEGR